MWLSSSGLSTLQWSSSLSSAIFRRREGDITYHHHPADNNHTVLHSSLLRSTSVGEQSYYRTACFFSRQHWALTHWTSCRVTSTGPLGVRREGGIWPEKRLGGIKTPVAIATPGRDGKSLEAWASSQRDFTTAAVGRTASLERGARMTKS